MLTVHRLSAHISIQPRESIYHTILPESTNIHITLKILPTLVLAPISLHADTHGAALVFNLCKKCMLKFA